MEMDGECESETREKNNTLRGRWLCSLKESAGYRGTRTHTGWVGEVE